MVNIGRADRRHGLVIDGDAGMVGARAGWMSGDEWTRREECLSSVWRQDSGTRIQTFAPSRGR
jgi:hypothetical protein